MSLDCFDTLVCLSHKEIISLNIIGYAIEYIYTELTSQVFKQQQLISLPASNRS